MTEKLKALERENRELRRANEILRKASTYFAQAELGRRAMIAFIDDYREVYGVELCKALPIAPSSYHAHVALRIDAAKHSARARRDAELKVEVQRVFVQNFSVCGARKSLAALRREGSRLTAAPSSG